MRNSHDTSSYNIGQGPAEGTYARVALVDDDERARIALAEELTRYRFEVIPFGSVWALMAWLTPDTDVVILAETRSSLLDGQALLTALEQAGCRQPVIGISAHESVASVVPLMKRGVLDFIEKPCAMGALLDALRGGHARLAGTSRLGGTVPLQLDKLTPRETEVLGHLVEGLATKVIAARLGISPRTAEIHRANVFAKTGARSIAELVRLCMGQDSLGGTTMQTPSAPADVHAARVIGPLRSSSPPGASSRQSSRV